MFAVLFLRLVFRAFALDTVQYGTFTQTATFSIAQQLGFFTSKNLSVIYD